MHKLTHICKLKLSYKLLISYPDKTEGKKKNNPTLSSLFPSVYKTATLFIHQEFLSNEILLLELHLL